MILETRLPTPADIIRVPQVDAFYSANSGFSTQSEFPSTMLTEDLDTSSITRIRTSTIICIFVIAGLGIATAVAYHHYKRKKKLQYDN